MKVIYVSGPFRGSDSWQVEQNVRRAEALALEVWLMGYACICPHANTRFFQGAADDSVWLHGDIEILKRCDGMLLVENWEKSVGTRAEIEKAIDLGIPIFLTPTDLLDWKPSKMKSPD